MHQSNALGLAGRHIEKDLEEAEAYLGREVLTYERAWPEHYREAEQHADQLLDKFLDVDQAGELGEAIAAVQVAGEAFQLRIGFELGRAWATFGELTDADICRAVQAAGGNPGRALAEVVEHELARVVQ